MNQNSHFSYSYLWLVLAMLNFILSPITIAFAPDYVKLIIVINFSLIILAGTNVGVKSRKNTTISTILGILSLLGIWIEFAIDYEIVIAVLRLLFNLLFYLFVAYRVFYWIIVCNEISGNTILASIAGFLLIGFIGGAVCESLERLIPGSFNIDILISSYSYIYFSFITLTSVGYGDIAPANVQGQAISLLLGIAGQFYMAVLVGILVGKYLSTKNQAS